MGTFAAIIKAIGMKKNLFLICLTLASVGATAQNEGRLLSLEEAVEIATTENPAIKASEYEAMAAKRQRQAAIGLRMPKINAVGTYVYMGDDIALDANSLKEPVGTAAGNLISTGVQTGIISQQLAGLLQQTLGAMSGLDWTYKLQDRSFGFVGGEITMPIFLGGKINAANRAARIDESTVREQGVQTRNALISELVERYYGLSLAAQVVEVRRQVADGIRKHLNDAIALEEQGMLAKSERLYVEYMMTQAERDLQNAKLQLSTIKDALNNTLASSEVDYVPATSMFVVDNIEDVEYYKSLASNHNPLLNQVSLKKELAEQGVRVQRSAYFPQIVAMGGGSVYNYQVTNMLPRWAVGVGVSFNIFDGLNREYKHAAAKQTVRQVEQLQTKAHEDISVLVEKLYNQMLNYYNQFHSVEASIAFAEEYLKAKNAAFLEGWSSSSDLIDAELNLAKVRTERIQMAYSYDVALAKLLEAAGVSDEFTSYSRRIDARQITFE